MYLPIFLPIIAQFFLLYFSSARSTQSQSPENLEFGSASRISRQTYWYNYWNDQTRFAIQYPQHNPFLSNANGNPGQWNSHEPLRFPENYSPSVNNPFLDKIISTAPPPVNSPFLAYPEPLEGPKKSRSETKCDEYNGATGNKRQIVPMANDGSITTTEEPFTFHKLVIGGNEAAPFKYRHIAALGKRTKEENFSFKCGGSLIAPKWILTAAHCTHGNLGGIKIARLGINNLSDTTGVTVGIKRSIRHPSYKPPAMYADLALLELERPIAFTDNIKPACLYQEYHKIPESAWVCGWGVTEYEDTKNSDSLQEASLEVIDNVKCALLHNSSLAVPDGIVPSMICAGSPSSNWKKDSCHGDSGGPLQISHPNYPNIYHIVGLTSFGSGCAIENSPGVYTRISHYLEWIENTVWPGNS